MINKELIQRMQYEQQGPYHRRSLGFPFHPGRVRYDLSLQFLSNHLVNHKALDFGGGDGAMASLLADRGAIVTIVDPISLALAYARGADERLSVVQARTKLPFPNASFQIVTMLETLEHIPDHEEMTALHEANRVLIRRGKLIVSVPSHRKKVPEKHYRHYDRYRLREALNCASFVIQQEIFYRDLLNGKHGTGVRLARGVAYGLDFLMRVINGGDGFVQCRSYEADYFLILAKKR